MSSTQDRKKVLASRRRWKTAFREIADPAVVGSEALADAANARLRALGSTERLKASAINHYRLIVHAAPGKKAVGPAHVRVPPTEEVCWSLIGAMADLRLLDGIDEQKRAKLLVDLTESLGFGYPPPDFLRPSLAMATSAAAPSALRRTSVSGSAFVDALVDQLSSKRIWDFSVSPPEVRSGASVFPVVFVHSCTGFVAERDRVLASKLVRCAGDGVRFIYLVAAYDSSDAQMRVLKELKTNFTEALKTAQLGPREQIARENLWYGLVELGNSILAALVRLLIVTYAKQDLAQNAQKGGSLFPTDLAIAQVLIGVDRRIPVPSLNDVTWVMLEDIPNFPRLLDLYRSNLASASKYPGWLLQPLLPEHNGIASKSTA